MPIKPISQAVYKCRELYITDPEGITLRGLSAKFKGHRGTSLENLRLYSKREGWPRLRAEYQTELMELSRLKSKPVVAKTLKTIAKARLDLVNHAAKSIEVAIDNEEYMTPGAASQVISNQGDEIIEHYANAGVGDNSESGMQLNGDRVKRILGVPNPMDDIE